MIKLSNCFVSETQLIGQAQAEIDLAIQFTLDQQTFDCTNLLACLAELSNRDKHPTVTLYTTD